MNLSEMYESLYGQSNTVPGEGFEKVAAATSELFSEADAHGRLMARAVVEKRLIDLGIL